MIDPTELAARFEHHPPRDQRTIEAHESTAPTPRSVPRMSKATAGALDIRSGDDHGRTRIEILPPGPGSSVCVVNAYAMCGGPGWSLRVSADIPLDTLTAWVHTVQAGR